jgi:hypothetical protein
MPTNVNVRQVDPTKATAKTAVEAAVVVIAMICLVASLVLLCLLLGPTDLKDIGLFVGP